jgi:hypothetical protein
MNTIEVGNTYISVQNRRPGSGTPCRCGQMKKQHNDSHRDHGCRFHQFTGFNRSQNRKHAEPHLFQICFATGELAGDGTELSSDDQVR